MNKRVSIFVISTVLLNSVLSNPLNAQNRLDSLLNIKQLLQKDNIISTPGVGLHQSPSKYWYAFVYMLYLASTEELNQMTEDISPALRIYSYAGLVHFNSSNLKNVKKRLYNDKGSVLTYYGCINGKPTDVASGTKQFIKIYEANENSINNLVSVLKNEEKYRNQLYDDLVNNRRIQLYPFKIE